MNQKTNRAVPVLAVQIVDQSAEAVLGKGKTVRRFTNVNSWLELPLIPRDTNFHVRRPAKDFRQVAGLIPWPVQQVEHDRIKGRRESAENTPLGPVIAEDANAAGTEPEQTFSDTSVKN